MANKALRSRGISQPQERMGPAHSGGSGFSSSNGMGAYAPRKKQLPAATPVGHERLKDLLENYRGFGMFSLIRALLFRGKRHAGLALISLLLLVGQWAGPFGFIAFKLRMLKLDDCPG